MFESVTEVIRALRDYQGAYTAASGSVVSPGRGFDIDADPFRRGFLRGIEERTELTQRLARLPEAERAVLLLWYAADLSVRDICVRLSVSRAHCYRLRDRALRGILEPCEAQAIA
jgi:DNA-directed RNA polymerase specialized sigma subunit